MLSVSISSYLLFQFNQATTFQMEFQLLAAISFIAVACALPTLRDSIRQPLHVFEGEDALLTCVVRNLESNTLLWKREDKERGAPRILTAGENRVTSDLRFDVLHDSAPAVSGSVSSGGDVWVLVIKSARAADTGTYICEINSNPILRSFHSLYVVPSKLEPPSNINPASNGNSSTTAAIDSTSSQIVNHNYTECCSSNNVTSACMGFCSLKNILDGTTGLDPEQCEADFPSIVKCMADGTNHVPCCIEEGVPDICQDICRGEYAIPTDDIRTHVSCSAYTEKTLACIAEGIEILPNAPEDVLVDILSDKALKISWTRPSRNYGSVTHYYVNISALPGFDSLEVKTGLTDAAEKDASDKKGSMSLQEQPFFMQIKIPADQNSTTVDSLNSFTMYEITVTSHNNRGSSLPSQKVRSLTESPKKTKTPAMTAPALPDIKECCTKKGVYHGRCVDKFCDPIRTADVSLPDLMICAPWASDSFSCLANGIDHTACCKSRGLPEPCIQLCTGNITRVDYNQFRCIQYMSELSNCLLQGYGVLPGPPMGFRVTHINPTFAILRWEMPKVLGKTVVSYNIRYRPTSDGNGTPYKTINSKSVPYILQNLMASTEYEVYVTALNEHGIGEPSTRILFRTAVGLMEATSSEAAYNVTACCSMVGVSGKCMPLCDYSAKLTDLRQLTQTCTKDFPKLLRCGAGGRNHVQCCERRGIPQACLGFCTGHVTEELVVTAAACLPYVGNVIQCFEEGTGLIPGPVIQLHATSIADDSLTLIWQPPLDGSVNHYVVHYSMIDELASKAIATAFEMDQQLHVIQPQAVINNLKSKQLYNFFVLAANDHGTSLPSSIITINITKEALSNGTISGVPSAPQGISVTSRSADYITVSWQQPALVHPTDRLTYTFYYRKRDDKSFNASSTTITSYRLDNLTASSQHIFYVTASNDNGESRPSETLMAWTDPAYEAVVEVPTIHPMNIVLEGGSMTVICVAMGTPMPTVSLYISGVLIRQEKTRHMVAVLSNVTRSMNHITCYANNGYGQTSEAFKRIIIGRRPSITGSLITMATLGDDVTLECEVDAHPTPKLSFSRDTSAMDKITNSSKYEVRILRENREPDANYIMQLMVRNMNVSDSGVYYCNAQNNFGTFAQVMKLQARQKAVPSVMNVAKCCEEQNVTSTCMDACTLFLDIESVIDRPECIGDFHKLMRCAADGSDHRGCCTQWGVPRRCLDWCRGEAVSSIELCALTYTKPIISCFHEGKERIPGPPRNVRIQLEKDNSVKVLWDSPAKNPDTVELYRVFWRLQGVKQTDKNDTRLTWLNLVGLKENLPYELVVKAGNRDGTSTLTEPLVFTLSDKYIISTSTHSNNPQIGVAVGVVVALILIVCAVVCGVYCLRKRNIIGIKLTGGMRFDNAPFRGNSQACNDTLQIVQNEVVNDASEVATPNGGWRQEALEVVPATEVGPSLYEELRLGTDGAGFKRLK